MFDKYCEYKTSVRAVTRLLITSFGGILNFVIFRHIVVFLCFVREQIMGNQKEKCFDQNVNYSSLIPRRQNKPFVSYRVLQSPLDQLIVTR